MFSFKSPTREICGCYFVQDGTRQRQYLPQTKLHSYTKITPVCFSTQLEQRFSNSNDTSIKELRYVFPLYDGVSVGRYTIKYGDRELKGIVKQKAAARKTYEAAVQRGETASLLESLPSGIFGVTLGNIPPQTDIYVSIGYLGELKHDAGIDGLRYNLPTSIAPRYGSYPTPILHTQTVVQDGISIVVDINMGKSAIRRIQSPSHPIAVTMGNLSTETASNVFAPSQGFAQLTQGHTDLGSDFILQILVDDISRPQALIETHEKLKSRAIMATFVPRFNLPLSRPEIVFIADQSGSMSGSKNEELKAALHVFLRSLPFGVRFNVCAFGSRYQYLFAKSESYNEENLQTAIRFVDTFQAQYGGTEIYEPVHQAFLRRRGDLPMEIMLLTDGGSTHEQQLFQMIHQSLSVDQIDARVFTLGIGEDVSHTLVEGVARGGRGFAQFITKNEETDSKLLRMLRASLFPHTKDHSLEINFADREEDSTDGFEIIEKFTHELHIEDDAHREQNKHTRPSPPPVSLYDESVELDTEIQSLDRYAGLPALRMPKFILAPSDIPPLFPFNRTNLYFLLGPDAPEKSVRSVTLRATAPSGPLELIIPVTRVENGTMINQLAARKAVQELENGSGYIQEGVTIDGEPVKQKFDSRLPDLVEREAVRLGEEYQIANKWCSFVAVDTQKEATTNAYGPVINQPNSGAAQHVLRAALPPPAPAASMFARSNKAAHVRYAMASHSFGATLQSAQQQCQMTKPAGVFGGASASAGGGLFGAASTSTTSFGAASTSAGASLFGAFGAKTAARPTGSFGEVKKKRGGHGGLFGASSGPWADEDFISDESIQVDACQSSVPGLGYNSEHARPATITAQSAPAVILRVIINAQKFAGYWEWDDYVLGLLGLTRQNMSVFDHDERSATAVIVAYLEKKMNAHRDVWELIAEKARNWLQDQVPADSLQPLLTMAKDILV